MYIFETLTNNDNPKVLSNQTIKPENLKIFIIFLFKKQIALFT